MLSSLYAWEAQDDTECLFTLSEMANHTNADEHCLNSVAKLAKAALHMTAFLLVRLCMLIRFWQLLARNKILQQDLMQCM